MESSFTVTPTNHVMPLITKSIQAGQLVPFVGAGISFDAPSNIPLWQDFVRRLVEEICRKVPAHLSTLSPEDWLDRLSSVPKFQGLRPELLIEFVYDHLAITCIETLGRMTTRPFNANHYMCACLARMSGRFITTNFDTCVEQVLINEMGMRPRNVDASDSKPTEPKDVQVLKLHGALDDGYSMVFTLRQAARTLAPRRVEALQKMVKESDLLFVGYSGNDDDILPILLDLLERNICHRVFVFFFDQKSAENDSIRELVVHYPERVTATVCTAIEFTKLIKEKGGETNVNFRIGKADNEKLEDLINIQSLAVGTSTATRVKSLKSFTELEHHEPSEKHLAVLADILSHLGERALVVDNIQWDKVADERAQSIRASCLMRLGRFDEAYRTIEALHPELLGENLDYLLNRYSHIGDEIEQKDGAVLVPKSIEVVFNQAVSMGDFANALGQLRNYQGNSAAAVAAYSFAYNLRTLCKLSQPALQSLHNIAVTIRMQGSQEHQHGNSNRAKENWSRALKLFQNALDMAYRIGDRFAIGPICDELGQTLFSLGRPEEARDYYRRSFDVRKELADWRGVGITLNNLGVLELEIGNFEEAEATLTESLEITRRIKDQHEEATTLRNLGDVSKAKKEYETAIRRYKDAVDIRQVIGPAHLLLTVLNQLVVVLIDCGKHATASQYLRKNCIPLAHDLGNRHLEIQFRQWLKEVNFSTM